MLLDNELYLAAGLGALGLGGGALLREPGRARNRVFALLCGALALWCLGVAAASRAGAPELRWHRLYLLGSCAAAPLALHLTVVLCRAGGRIGRRALPAAYALAALLYLTAWTPLHDAQKAWNVAALVLLAGILLAALWILGRHAASLGPGAERSAFRLLLGAGIVAVVGGLSDFLPRGGSQVPRVGPAALLLFLLVVCAVLVRHRFLDVDRFLAGALALLLGAAAASLMLHAVARLSGDRILPLFVATLLVLAVAGPLRKGLLSGLRGLLGPADPVARALLGVSAELPRCRDSAELWRAVEKGLRALPGEAGIAVYAARGPAEPFRLAYRAAGADRTEPPQRFPRDAALARLLERERLPVDRRFLEEEAGEGRAQGRARAEAARAELESLGAELAVPLLRGRDLLGWAALAPSRRGGAVPGDVAAALMAVANQAVASLERIEAQEEARRRETLAAVGELAAGLAHEIRNPLGAIHGAAQILEGEAGPERSREMLEVIREESARLGGFVGEFLEYARPASPRREAVDLEDLARKVLRSAQSAGLGLRAEVAAATGAPPALADPDQIRRAFENIVRNAREAAGADGSLRVEVAPAEGGRVAARFEDDGPGIAPEELPRLFQPFHTTKPGGTGLGLALVHRIAESHGGEVRVEGRPGLGAAFTLLLPAAEVRR